MMNQSYFKKKYLLIASAFLVGAAILYLLLLPASVPVETAKATVGTFEETVREDGVTRIRERYSVLAPVSGILRRVKIHPGDSVRRGSRVAAIRWDRDIPVLSPVDGVVLKVLRESEGPVEMGTPILEVGDPSSLEVVADLLTADTVKIRPGTPVRIERWGGETPLEGRVDLVEPSAYTKLSALGVEEQRVNVVTRITTPGSVWKGLGDRYRVDCTFLLSQQNDVLRIPSGALFRDGESWSVFRVEKGRARKTPVRLSVRGSLMAVVQEGLKEGDEVIVYPGESVHDGVRIDRM